MSTKKINFFLNLIDKPFLIYFVVNKKKKNKLKKKKKKKKTFPILINLLGFDRLMIIILNKFTIQISIG